jgi:hypothetical protein
MKQIGLLRMRAAISLPTQMEQRRCFWCGHDTVGNKPLNYIVSIMKQMGLLRMRAAISLPAQKEQRRPFWWGHDTVGNKPLNFILSRWDCCACAQLSAFLRRQNRSSFWWGHDTVGNKPSNYIVSSVADPGCLSRILDPDFYPTRIPDPGIEINREVKKNLLSYFFL